ncbi:MAG TPA: ACT domain-containing protein, partial [Tepidisphaeraceae bacterium]|nr:ACT domain-containing protein [Tepidisphaeraceae bacterium]
HAILTAIGADRSGLVDEVSEFIFSRGGNIEDSRMVNLRGQFAIVVLVGGGEDVLGRVRADVGELSRRSGLHVEVREATAPAVSSPEQSLPYRLTGTAIDQPGLVHRLSRLLRDARVNIESLDTHLTAAPYTGAPMFEMELILSVPKSTSVSQLRQNISKLCDELNVDWTLDPA